MSDNQVDPSGNTEAFRAFTRTTPDAEAPSKLPLVIGGVVAAVVLIAVIVWLAL
ncbi:hypothetical protein Ait01nite_006220 [Actinoplanes italicus]|uniref:Flagellin-like protein n=1 Tax=Actinoplanes italicus TaxID=113567 RepID=A0A2T0KM35_9ACTN|nr:hypothetical protein [Actinoplanes italicus]PRX24695.1 hypothetical protein CLV67_102474 [Actinoplanes italicus]GIE27577.1 hypothetical protein Ait01nite_006220 [Actinoplanes italicus]